MVGHHVWIAIEETFANAEDVKTGAENNYQTNAEHNPQRKDRFAVGMHDSYKRSAHN